MGTYHSLPNGEINDRIERLEAGSPTLRYMSYCFVGVVAVVLGGLLSATGIGALLGIPAIIAGLLLAGYGVFGSLIRPFTALASSSVWKDTALEEPSAENRRHRKLNTTFSGRCPACGEFLSLRDTSENAIPDAGMCDACGATLDGEEIDLTTTEWRLADTGAADDERLGERKPAEEWVDEQRARAARSSRSSPDSNGDAAIAD